MNIVVMEITVTQKSGDEMLKAALLDIQAAAYRAGWDDAIAAMRKAAETVKDIPAWLPSLPTLPPEARDAMFKTPATANTEHAVQEQK